MKIWLHHINLCTNDVPAMDKFYRAIMGLHDEPTMEPLRDKSSGDGYTWNMWNKYDCCQRRGTYLFSVP